MNYMAARELKGPDGKGCGKFHYTLMRDGVTVPVGYCAGWQPWLEGPDPESKVPEAILDTARKRLAPFKAKFHTEPHASPEEACECYRQFMLDTQANYDHKLTDEQRKCQVCGEWTSSLASVGGVVFVALCDAHRNRENLAKWLTVGSSVES